MNEHYNNPPIDIHLAAVSTDFRWTGTIHYVPEPNELFIEMEDGQWVAQSMFWPQEGLRVGTRLPNGGIQIHGRLKALEGSDTSFIVESLGG